MKRADLDVFCCPQCRGALQWDGNPETSQRSPSEEILKGSLLCSACGCRFSITKGIPRFISSKNYAASFGYQWNKFARTQVGGAQKAISKIRFEDTARWPSNLAGQKILEAGCGAGRFSEIALETGAEVYSFDLSEAVDANLGNIRSAELKSRHHLFQASIYNIPLAHETFDKIFCLGVLQHCPDVKRAYHSLVPFLKPGGELVVDCYLSQPLKHAFNLKYWLRPFLKWWKPSWLFWLCSTAVSLAYDLKALLAKVPWIGKRLAGWIPIGRLDYEPEYHFSVEEIKEIKALSMFDMISPKYDKCQTLESFQEWMAEAGLEIVRLSLGFNGINALGRRPR